MVIFGRSLREISFHMTHNKNSIVMLGFLHYAYDSKAADIITLGYLVLSQNNLRATDP